MIETITMNAKGQVTIPANIRKQLNIKSGQEILCESTTDGNLQLSPKKSIFELMQNFNAPKNKRKKPITDEEIKKSIATAISKRHLRTKH